MVCQSFCLCESSQISKLELFTDAAKGIGMGAYFQGEWTYMRWPPEIHDLDLLITFLELYPIVIAVVAVINKQTSKCTRMMCLVRMLVLDCLKLNIVFKAKHIPGVDNDLADALSRLQVQRFRQLAPNAKAIATPCPLFTLEL